MKFSVSGCVIITLTERSPNSQTSTKKNAVGDPARGLLDRKGGKGGGEGTTEYKLQ